MALRPGLTLGILGILLILSECRPAPDRKWERAEAGLPRQTVVLALAADPADPTRLWAGYYAPGGLATSRDGGRTWTTGAVGLGDNPVFDLLPLSGGPLWAATRDGLLQSADGGKSWGSTAASLPSVAAFALAADGSRRVYVGLDGAGLYAREQGGGRWVSLAHNEALATAAVLSLAVSPEGKQVYAGTAGQGLFASQDAGHTWMNAFSGHYVPNLAVKPSQPMTAVASLRDRLVRTEDGGKSWDVLPIPWARDEVVSLLWDPLGEAGDVLWAGSGRGRVYRSWDEGDTWVEMGNGLPPQGGVLALARAGDQLFAGTWTGIYASPVPLVPAAQAQAGQRDEGQSWTYLSPSLGVPYANALLAADGGLLLGTRAGLFRWQPDVRRWARVSAKYPQDMEHSQRRDFPPGGVTALAVAPLNGQIVYAGAAASGLYRSNNGGASWMRVPSELEIGIRALAVAPGNPDHVYILAAWERMYESRDGGQSWQARWAGLGVTTEAISLAIDPLDPQTVYLGADTGLYRSRYGGENWRPVGRPLDDQTVLALRAERPRRGPQVEAVVARPALGAASVLYMGATRGAYRSYDGGDTVEPWGHGLEGVSVTAFLFDPNDAGSVYAGTAYAGLYQSVDGGETWRPTGPAELANEVVEGMAWGPAGELFVASAGGVWVGKD